MKKKYAEEDSENEFSVDEPEELEESDDDWTPAASETRGGRRQPARRGRPPVSAKKPRLAEPRTSEEEEEPEEEEDEEEEEEEEESQPESDEENEKAKKKRGRGGTTATRGGRGRARKITSTATSPSASTNDKETETETDTDITSTTASENALPVPVEKEFTSGAFVVLKADYQNQKDPPIWKIDGKALLQKYVPFEQDGKILYRNTSTYSGWSTVLKDRYHPAQIAFKMQNRKETVVEFLREKIKVEDSE